MKLNKKQVIICAIIAVAILGVVGFYLFEVLYLKKPYTQNLFRMIAITLALISTFIRCLSGAGRNSLDFYEKAYDKDIRHAFKENTLARKNYFVL